MSEERAVGFREANLLGHPAIKAWSKLQPESVPPTGIVRLQNKKKRCVYRLEGVGPGGSAVIAKCSSPERIRVERTIYEQVLPGLPIPAVRYYGFIEAGARSAGPVPGHDACCWLFLENVGGEEYSPLIKEHRGLAAQWLGLLHTGAAGVAAAARLPDRGPGHFREHLRSARARILTSLVNPALGADDVAVLQTVLSQCEILESRWNQIERICEGMPQTFVHGDFNGKNVVVRTSEAGSVLLPFDWGQAGWGVPAIDLAGYPLAGAPLSIPGFSGAPEIAVYWAGIRDHWPGFDLPTVQQWAEVGTLFRSLAAINWEAVNLAYEWVESPIMKFRIYQATMASAMQATRWVG